MYLLKLITVMGNLERNLPYNTHKSRHKRIKPCQLSQSLDLNGQQNITASLNFPHSCTLLRPYNSSGCKSRSITMTAKGVLHQITTIHLQQPTYLTNDSQQHSHCTLRSTNYLMVKFNYRRKTQNLWSEQVQGWVLKRILWLMCFWCIFWLGYWGAECAQERHDDTTLFRPCFAVVTVSLG